MISCSVAHFSLRRWNRRTRQSHDGAAPRAERYHQDIWSATPSRFAQNAADKDILPKACQLRFLFIAVACSIMRHNPFCPQLRPATGKGDKIGKKTARGEKIKKGRAPTSPQRDRKVGWRQQMLRDHFINFLEAAVVLLALTNAFSVVAAAYAISLARGLIRADSRVPTHHGLLDFLARRMRIGN
jgi:hypothetical protein